MSPRWQYTEPDPDSPEPRVVTLTEDEIIAQYFGYWADQMRRAGKAKDITRRGCIDDWVVVHWAERVAD